MALRGGPIGSSSAASTVPGWRADEFQRVQTEFFEEGVVRGLAVSQRGAGANMSVDVSAGLALIEVTTTLLSTNSTFKTWLESDAVVNIPVPTADSTNERIDRIVAVFDMTINPDGSASNNVSIELVEGTPAGSPSAPATPSNAISLATISVPASDTAIGSAQITDDRTMVVLDSAVLADIAREADVLKKTRLQLASATELTIATGAITVTQPLHSVDTESDAASDDLATVTSAYGAGEIVILYAANDARTVVVKHGTGNIETVDGEDFEMDNDDKAIALRYTGSVWKELWRAAPITAAAGITPLAVVTAASSPVGASNTTELTLSPTWTGSLTIPGGTLAVGSRVRISLGGEFDQAADLVTIRVKVGGTEIFHADITGISSGHNRSWHLDTEIICRVASATGKLIGYGSIAGGHTASGFTGGAVRATNFDAPTEITKDTTGDLALTFTAQFTSSNGNNFIYVTAGAVDLIAPPA